MLATNGIAHIMGYSKETIAEGVYGFNAVLLGMALGYEFDTSPMLLLVILVAALLGFINQIWIHGILHKYHLPVLSLPFLITVWMVMLALRESDLLSMARHLSVDVQLNTDMLSELETGAKRFTIPYYITNYFYALGGVFFQPKLIAGIAIAAGLLYFSRIAFALTFIAYTFAWLCIGFMGAELDWLRYQSGANFIFMAIALGGFFVVPSVYSYISVLVMVPVVILVHLFFGELLKPWNLPLFTLAFTFVTLAFLYLLRARHQVKKLKLIDYQYYSPEEAVYQAIHSEGRYKNRIYTPIELPFWGEWAVSQGYNGKHTHLGPYSKALDFVILDEQLKQYTDPGTSKTDYYCFAKPVLAPADGYIYNATDMLDDNEPGGMDMTNNWGNSLVIMHAEGVFTQLSHLKKESLKVKLGDYVKRGDVIALGGSSGRSPEPHLHFQVQKTYEIGDETLAYPLAYYISRENKTLNLHQYETPKEGQLIRNIERTPLLTKAFGLYPGMKFTYTINQHNHTEDQLWEVFTDAYNQTYIYCHTTQSIAYFVNDGALFYFTRFSGSKQSALYYFYLAAYKVVLGYYTDMVVKDTYPLNQFNNPLAAPLQDFLVPFFRVSKVDYQSQAVFSNNVYHPTEITIQAKALASIVGFDYKHIDFTIELKDNVLHSITANRGINKTTIQWKS